MLIDDLTTVISEQSTIPLDMLMDNFGDESADNQLHWCWQLVLQQPRKYT